MGTRASFWIGDPRDLDNRRWLGCIAWDGYPDGDCSKLSKCKSAPEFERAVGLLAKERDDFANPEGGWPFPWDDDIFLTDYTYAFFDGHPRSTRFHCPFMPMRDEVKNLRYFDADENELENAPLAQDDPSMANVPAPGKYDRSQPDSIMIIRAKAPS
ncbi:MAG: hypothetical protein ACR2P5_04665 [Gammaproteobacteria bacterium]